VHADVKYIYPCVLVLAHTSRWNENLKNLVQSRGNLNLIFDGLFKLESIAVV